MPDAQMPDSFHLDAVPIRLERCGKTFAGGARALEPLDLTIRGGEIVYDLGGLSVPEWPQAPAEYWRLKG